MTQSLCFLSNTSSEGRRSLILDGGIQLLVYLSSNYNNKIQQDAARAICNLSFIEGMEKIMEEQGAVKALMVIGLVWTDHTETQILCAKALLNILCGEDSRSPLIQDGVISAFVSFSHTTNEELLSLCALSFNNVSFLPEGRARLIKERNLSALVNLLSETKSMKTRQYALQALSNLFYCFGDKFASVATHHKMLRIFNSLLENSDSETRAIIISCLAIVSSNVNSAMSLVSDDILKLLSSLNQDEDNRLLVASTFANISSIKEVRGEIGLKSGVCRCIYA